MSVVYVDVLFYNTNNTRTTDGRFEDSKSPSPLKPLPGSKAQCAQGSTHRDNEHCFQADGTFSFGSLASWPPTMNHHLPGPGEDMNQVSRLTEHNEHCPWEPCPTSHTAQGPPLTLPDDESGRFRQTRKIQSYK